jgi:hypothetical protein
MASDGGRLSPLATSASCSGEIAVSSSSAPIRRATRRYALLQGVRERAVLDGANPSQRGALRPEPEDNEGVAAPAPLSSSRLRVATTPECVRCRFVVSSLEPRGHNRGAHLSEPCAEDPDPHRLSMRTETELVTTPRFTTQGARTQAGTTPRRAEPGPHAKARRTRATAVLSRRPFRDARTTAKELALVCFPEERDTTRGYRQSRISELSGRLTRRRRLFPVHLRPNLT